VFFILMIYLLRYRASFSAVALRFFFSKNIRNGSVRVSTRTAALYYHSEMCPSLKHWR